MTTRTDTGGWPVLPRGAVGPWLRQGARAALLRRPRWSALEESPPTPPLIVVLLLLSLGLAVVWERALLEGTADFQWRALTHGWLSTLVAAWLCWWVAGASSGPVGEPRPDAPTLFAVNLVQQTLVVAFSSAVLIGLPRLPSSEPTAWAQWGVWWASTAWLLLAEVRLLWPQLGGRWRSRAVLVVLAAFGHAIHVLAPSQPLWTPRVDARMATGEGGVLRLTPELIEQQRRATDAALAALRPQRPGRVDLFVLSFAPYGAEDVFLRESALVASVLTERFDAQGHVLQLVNHPATAAALPWATATNLERAVARIAALMDRDEDVLLVHLTSHGARDGQLAASLVPLELSPLTPQQLRAALDAAGVRYRVLSVSACYSGSWIEPLASDTTLVMTAADAEHTSYGCGLRSPLTFFGRALFDEQLRRTRSFEEAHAAARAVIAQREREAGKSDGYSNPQIRVGAAIRGPLARLAAQFDAGSPVAAAYNARRAEDQPR